MLAMPSTRELSPHVDALLARSRAHVAERDWPAAWSALELAHVLSQPSARLHTKVHVRMLVLGARLGDLREVVGQIVRVAGAGLGSALGRFPAGNTGRARVSIIAPMPVPDEARRIFASLGIDIEGVTIAGRARR
ncbi:Hypothetical protein I5071_66370 [Sandaracinus amylolyticus]|nr:Hypothetical protein I5071_66370 [Sandaracinus amylolyticus]